MTNPTRPFPYQPTFNWTKTRPLPPPPARAQAHPNQPAPTPRPILPCTTHPALQRVQQALIQHQSTDAQTHGVQTVPPAHANNAQNVPPTKPVHKHLHLQQNLHHAQPASMIIQSSIQQGQPHQIKPQNGHEKSAESLAAVDQNTKAARGATQM